jgi:mRNA interferase MazF
MTTYKQGDIVVVNFPFTDISQTKKRPALVISNQQVNQTGDYLLVQITSQFRNDGLSLPILPTDFTAQPLLLDSYVRLHKIFLLNESLIIRKATMVTPTFYNRLIDAIISFIR